MTPVLRDSLLLLVTALAASAHTPPWIRDEGIVAVRDIPVQLRVPAGLRLREVCLQSPDGLPPQELRAALRRGIAELRVPALRVYDLLLFRFDRS